MLHIILWCRFLLDSRTLSKAVFAVARQPHLTWLHPVFLASDLRTYLGMSQNFKQSHCQSIGHLSRSSHLSTPSQTPSATPPSYLALSIPIQHPPPLPSRPQSLTIQSHPHHPNFTSSPLPSCHPTPWTQFFAFSTVRSHACRGNEWDIYAGVGRRRHAHHRSCHRRRAGQ
ncbi:hypothetical protein P154DRAFT_63758 [Amniculicola lignicola CBS 123094]|uniref:Uncharacterized protein n=1 Tax=Amniculicola lignicola CBS 123094 TaxID=1392246 RepID=A0A6A5WQ17_9PLEO|nr:hypothetical protein P154DRAFT_63758 [Amniculicola lignicola CBS 123094]